MSKVEQILQLIENDENLLKLIKKTIQNNLSNLSEADLDRILNILNSQG